MVDRNGRQQRFLLDPFLNDSPTSPVKADAVKANYILLSHGHGDHLGDTVAIAKRTGATVITNFEVGEWLKKKGVAERQSHRHESGRRHRAAVWACEVHDRASQLQHAGWHVWRRAGRLLAEARRARGSISPATRRCFWT